MTDQIWPSQVTVGESTLSPVSNVGTFSSPLTGATRRIDRSGHRWRLVLSPPVQTRANGRAAKALYAILGSGADALLCHDHSYVRAGAFPAVELLTNPTFEQGTAGWTSDFTLSAADRVLRSMVDSMNGVDSARLAEQQGPSATLYAPLVFRLMSLAGRGTGFSHRIYAGPNAFTVDYGGETNAAAARMHTLAFVPWQSTLFVGWHNATASGSIAGDFLSTPYTSLSRCLLVDAGPNALIRSDEFDNAAWALNNLTITPNAVTAPDGTSTADALVEDATAGVEHFVEQGSVTVSSGAHDRSFAVALNAGNRNWFALRLVEDTGPSTADVFFDVQNGEVGTINNGANWANTRGFIRSLGGGWWYCCIVARKTNAATVCRGRIDTASANGTLIFTGNGLTAGRAWRATMAASSVPTRLVATTTAATNGASPTGGVIHVKGGRTPSEGALAGALLMGDLMEVQTSRGSQLMTVPQLDLDAAGLGTITGARPPLRGTVLDNAPVILHQPMGRWLPVNPQTGWRNKPGGFSEPEPLELLEDIAPAA